MQIPRFRVSATFPHNRLSRKLLGSTAQWGHGLGWFLVSCLSATPGRRAGRQEGVCVALRVPSGRWLSDGSAGGLRGGVGGLLSLRLTPAWGLWSH